MNTKFSLSVISGSVLCLIFAGMPYLSYSQDPVDYVDPYIGSIGHLLKATTPDVQLPRGMIRLIPRTTPGIRDTYLADKIYAFSAKSLSNDFSVEAFTIMATTGDIRIDPNENASMYDHDIETATPYHYSVFLEDYNIEAEYTATQHSAFYQFTFPKSEHSNLLIGMLQDAALELVSSNAIEGYQISTKGNDVPRKIYFYSIFSKPIDTFGAWKNEDAIGGEKEESGNNIGLYTTYSTQEGEKIRVKVGFSFISTDQAKQNLEKEISGWDFDRIKKNGRSAWNKALNKVQIEGGTETERTIFYTALYRVFGRKTTNISEYGQYFSSFDNKVHSTHGHDFYQMGESWGSCRSLYPLGLLLEPERQNDIIRSYIRMYEQTGWLGDAALQQRVMIARHETVTITDAYFKGFRDFDVENAYAGMRKNALRATMLPWRNGPLNVLDSVYGRMGFFPALALGQKEWVPEVHPFERRQAVSVTLEHCYDDWCLAQMAKALNKEDDYEFFRKRALNYKNLYDSRIGFMAPKRADGTWVYDDKMLDPIWSGGQGGREYYTETNAWTYTFHVPQDIAGLIELIGGKEKFRLKLDALFQTQYDGGTKFKFLNQFPDGTGLIGQYSHGNQPGFHIAYLYNYAGEPWKTQRRVRDIMKIWYDDSPLGICGDEDEGELSSWYVFSAMGFYPVCPGNPVYDIGSPLFSKVSIDVGNGRKFHVEARDVSAKNKYIQSALLNGVPLHFPRIDHADLIRGGSLVLHMGPRPNLEWGR
jgi:predicted alpha-1,2-mannosidase